MALGRKRNGGRYRLSGILKRRDCGRTDCTPKVMNVAFGVQAVYDVLYCIS